MISSEVYNLRERRSYCQRPSFSPPLRFGNIRRSRTSSASEGLPLVGYTWWPLFSLLDWAYREGEKPAEDYLWHMGMYDLEPDGKGGFLRVETPVVRAFWTATKRTSEPLSKEREQKEDGRYIIFYTFEEEED